MIGKMNVEQVMERLENHLIRTFSITRINLVEGSLKFFNKRGRLNHSIWAYQGIGVIFELEDPNTSEKKRFKLIGEMPSGFRDYTRVRSLKKLPRRFQLCIFEDETTGLLSSNCGRQIQESVPFKTAIRLMIEEFQVQDSNSPIDDNA